MNLPPKCAHLANRLNEPDSRRSEVILRACAHYVTRLVEWSEKQDKFQADALRRFREFDERLPKLEEK